MAERPKMERLETKAEEIVKLVHEVETSQYYLRFDAHKEDMELRASFKPLSGEAELSKEEVLSIFDSIGVVGHIDNETLAKFCKSATRRKTLRDVLLVTGTPAKKGDDQRIDFHAKPSSENEMRFEEYDENKDYHNLNLFENVTQDQLIAEVFFATEGTPGRTVLGAQVEGTRGLVFKRERRAGRNVRMSEDGTQFYSDINGRILYDENRGILEVSDKYEIRGDVGYRTGNVDFIGHVVVRGDVIDSYNIKAGLSLRIDGHIGNCQIECNGNIEFIGIDGKNEAKIISGAEIKGRYVHEASVEAQGNIELVRESVNSNLSSEKIIYLSRGSIIGGDSIALCGIEVNEVGSDSHVPTKLTAGISYVIRQKITDLRKELQELEESVDKMNKRLNPFVTNPRNLLALNDEGREQIKEMAKNLKETVTHKDEVAHALKEIRETSREEANPMINILSTINPRSTLVLGTSVQQVKERKVLQSTVLENSVRGGLRFASLYKLSRRAKDIEAEIAVREKERVGSS